MRLESSRLISPPGSVALAVPTWPGPGRLAAPPRGPKPSPAPEAHPGPPGPPGATLEAMLAAYLAAFRPEGRRALRDFDIPRPGVDAMPRDYDEIGRQLDAHVAALMEHVDSVQVFVTYRDGRETVGLASGAGDWYARRGVVEEWSRGKRAIADADAIRADRDMQADGGGEPA